MEGNNTRGNIAFLRDTFLEAEKEYLEELMKEPRYKAIVEKLEIYNPEKLLKEAFIRIDDIENGRVEPENLEIVETEIILIFAAIQDCVIDKVKEKTMDRYEDKDKEKDEDEDKYKYQYQYREEELER